MPRARPWTPAEDALLGTHLDRVVATGLRRSPAAVATRRNSLKIRPFMSPANWGATELSMLGCYPDTEVAAIIGRSLKDVQAKRAELNSGHG